MRKEDMAKGRKWRKGENEKRGKVRKRRKWGKGENGEREKWRKGKMGKGRNEEIGLKAQL